MGLVDMNNLNIVGGKWLTLAPIPGVRSHPAVTAHDGVLYAFGGGAENFRSLNDSWAYDTVSNAWVSRRAMPTKRSGTVCHCLEDKIYVMGGGFKQANGKFRFLPTLEIYTPRSDTWESAPDLLQPHDYPAFAFLDGWFYVLGGHHPDATEGGPQTDPGFAFCERWRPGMTQWEAIAPLPTPRFALAAVVHDGEIWTMGGVAFSASGFHNFDFFEVYQPATNTWRRETRYQLPWTAAGLGACLVEGRLHIFGGYSGDGIHARAARMDWAGGGWELLPPMPHTLAAMGVGTWGSSVYLVGGWPDARRDPTDQVYVYTP